VELDDPVRVLIVSNLYPDEVDPAKGVFVRNIENSLRIEGLEVDVIAVRNTRNRLQQLAAYGKFYWRVIRRLLRRDVDLAYLHYVSHCAPPVLLSRLLGARQRVVSHVHGSDVLAEKGVHRLYVGAKRQLAQRVLAASEKVIVPSDYFRSVLMEQYGVAAGRIHVSPSGGVDMTIFRPIAAIDENRHEIRLGYVGRLIEEKGALDFIQLIQMLKDAGANVSATVVGDGPLRHRIESVAERLNIDYFQNIEQRDLAEVYQQLDIFIFPSRRQAESLGLVGIEAMACGVPVIAYRGTGPETYIEDRKSGFLVDPGDVTALQTAVAEYLNMPISQRQIMREAALQSAQPFDAEKTRVDLVGVLREAVA